MSAGIMLVSHGWGTSPTSHDIKITLPSTDFKQITPEMTPEQAADAYARTLAAQPRLEPPGDESATIEGEFVDVTPNEDGES
jgi:hypothetical protein